jgi:hypothetical protein
VRYWPTPVDWIAASHQVSHGPPDGGSSLAHTLRRTALYMSTPCPNEYRICMLRFVFEIAFCGHLLYHILWFPFELSFVGSILSFPRCRRCDLAASDSHDARWQQVRKDVCIGGCHGNHPASELIVSVEACPVGEQEYEHSTSKDKTEN